MGVKTAVVGYGFAGKGFHCYLISLADGLDLYAVSTHDPERRAAAETDYGVKKYASLDSLLEDDQVQLVVLATPHDTHKDMCVKIMDAGKHCVTDKVIAMNAAEAETMIEAAERNGVLFSVFHNRRWDGDYLTVKQAAESGLLGEWFAVDSAVTMYREARGWRRDKAQCGGQLFDWGAHLIDQAVQLIDAEPETVFCDARPVIWDTTTDSYCKLAIRFTNGLLYLIEVSRGARISKPRWFIQGEKGTLCKTGLDPQEAAMLAGDIDAAEYPNEDRARIVGGFAGGQGELVIETVPGNWKAYYQNIADVLNHGAELAVKPDGVLTAMRIIDAANESIETGKAVSVAE